MYKCFFFFYEKKSRAVQDTAVLTDFQHSQRENKDYLVFTGHNKAFDVASILFTHHEHQHLMRPDISLFRSCEYFR